MIYPAPTPDGRAFLGRGWAFPPRLDGATGEVTLAAYEEDVAQSIIIILATSPGERVMRPDFGAGLRELVFASATATTTATVRQRVEEALIEWEPRITVDQVDVELRTAGSTFSGTPLLERATTMSGRVRGALPRAADADRAPRRSALLIAPRAAVKAGFGALTDPDPSSAGPTGNCLLVTIGYTVRTTNSSFNLVFPFYLSEAGGP